MIGSDIGPYRVLAKLGAGGMGEVYRARDAKLDRDVAIKILPASVAADPDRLARFDREAKTLAALNHSNIAQMHGVVDQPPALVMELVEGEDLAQRLARGPIPIDEALPIARQIADALDAAHERGIIHRDLKPANIKLRADGTVKVLDFGLAKALDVSGSNPDLMNSPTITSPATQIGTILGTAAYMSPEQARGRAVDRRADVWAFGVVLFEMLTGRRAFGGDDVSMTLAAVLKEDVDLAALPPDTPQSIRRLLRRCLQKDPRKRLSAIGDARIEIDEADAEPAAAPAPPNRAGWRAPLIWASAGALGAIVLGAAGITMWRGPAASSGVVRSAIALDALALGVGGFRSFAIDPSGSEIVFIAQGEGQPARIYRRRLSENAAVPIAATDNAAALSFSSDGQWLLFVQQNRLKKMPAGGGGAVDIGDGGATSGVDLMADGSFILNPIHGEGLFRVDPSGASRTRLTTVAHDKGEAGHHWPHVLPGGTHVLFTVEIDGKPYSEARIEVVSLESGERKLLLEGGSDARYVSTGHLLYWREGDLWSAPFDLSRRELTGPATMAMARVMAAEPNGNAQFSVAVNGTAVYLGGRDPVEEQSLVLVNRAGVARPLTTERRAFAEVVVSRDGKRLVTTIVAANDSLWTMEIGRPSLTRITFEAENHRPVWSPDGTRLAMARYRGGEARRLFVMPADGATAPTLVRDSGGVAELAGSWAGSTLAFTRMEGGGSDIWVVDVESGKDARPFVATRFADMQPRFSPDGKWMAYVSDESGRAEVYLRPYPGPGQKRIVSSDGGSEPRWRGDGRELFYRKGDEVLAVDVTGGDAITFSPPRVLFKGVYATTQGGWSNWDVMPDGQGFLMIQSFAEPRRVFSLVQNWFEELRAGVSRGRQ